MFQVLIQNPGFNIFYNQHNFCKQKNEQQGHRAIKNAWFESELR